jgi:sugar-specific transcriptional regulator TrmB
MKKLSFGDYQRFGLTEKEAITYSTLLDQGECSVAVLSKTTGNKKGTTYNLLESLIKQGLVEQSQTKPKALFRVTDPAHFRKLIQQQQLQVQENAVLLESLLPHLVSTYNTTTNAPSVRTYEGLEGLKQMYKEMFKSGIKECLIFVSSKGNVQEDDETRNYMREMRNERTKLKIHTRIIGPELENTKYHYLNDNPQRLVKRRIVEQQFLQSPAEFTIWGNCVALTPMRDPQVITVIENTPIAETFRNIFEYMWTRSKPEHERIVKDWK